MPQGYQATQPSPPQASLQLLVQATSNSAAQVHAKSISADHITSAFTCRRVLGRSWAAQRAHPCQAQTMAASQATIQRDQARPVKPVPLPQQQSPVQQLLAQQHQTVRHLLPLRHQSDASISTDSGIPLLSRLCPQAFVSSSTEEGLILGFEAAGGKAVAIEDFGLGVVRAFCRDVMAPPAQAGLQPCETGGSPPACWCMHSTGHPSGAVGTVAPVAAHC